VTKQIPVPAQAADKKNSALPPDPTEYNFGLWTILCIFVDKKHAPILKSDKRVTESVDKIPENLAANGFPIRTYINKFAALQHSCEIQFLNTLMGPGHNMGHPWWGSGLRY
jgi:hypothetical protein